jgi:hypothetical protein
MRGVRAALRCRSAACRRRVLTHLPCALLTHALSCHCDPPQKTDGGASIWNMSMDLDIDDDVVLQVFSRDVARPAQPATTKKPSGGARPAASLIDGKRAHLLSIALKSIKAPLEAVREALATLDRSKLTTRDVEVLPV